MEHTLNELYLANDEKPVKGEDGLLWKTILREGTFAMTGTNKGTVKEPFTVIPEGKSDRQKRIVAMNEVLESFEDKAFEHVTIPLSHKDTVAENTGFIRKLKKDKDSQGREILVAGMDFTEPEIGEKCERGTIPNCSSGIFFDFQRKADGKTFPVALKHASLTNTPWIPELDPFGPKVFAADEEIPEDVEIEVYAMDDAGEIAWQENKSFGWLRDKVQKALDGFNQKARAMGSDVSYYTQDISKDNSALISDDMSGNKFIAGFKPNKEDVTLDDASQWQPVKPVLVAASDDETVNNQESGPASGTDGGVSHRNEENEEASIEAADTETVEPEDKATKVTVINLSDEITTPKEIDSLSRLKQAQEQRSLRIAHTSQTGGISMAFGDTLELDGLELSDEQTLKIQEAFDAKNRELEAEREEKAALALDAKKTAVEGKVQLLMDAGIKEPGFLKTYRRILLSDDGGTAAILAADEENKTEEEITLSDAIESLIAALPRDDEGKILLSEQALEVEAGTKPDNDTSTENRSQEELLADGYAALGTTREAWLSGGAN